MEMALQPHGSLTCRIRPAVAPFSQPSLRFGQLARVKLIPLMAASSEYSRRRQRKSAIPKINVSAPKGFAPKSTVTHKKEQNDFDANDGTLPAVFSEEVQSEEFDSGPGISSSVVKVTTEESEGDEGLGYDTKKKKDGEFLVEIPSATLDVGDGDRRKVEAVDKGDSLDIGKQLVAVIAIDEEVEDGKSTYTDKNLSDVENVIELEAAADKAQSGGISSEPIIFVSTKDAKTDTSEEVKKEKVLAQVQTGSEVAGEESTKAGGIKENKEAVVEDVASAMSNEVDQHEKHIVTKESDIEELVVMQKTHMDMQARRQRLEALAEESLSSGNKIFVFPELVKPDQVIEVFLNRSLSTLINENDVLIKGAFNGWRWKSFTEKMQKTELKGDWWSCSLNIPNEAYRIDFVFFNGGNVYENNGNQDFSILVNGEMNEYSFEDFLLVEKQKELDRLAAEQAERERQAEEQRRKEAERAAIEADKAQAKADVDRKRESLRQVIKLAKSIGDVWYTEPTVFKGGDRVRIFYNRSARTLAHAEEVWIHGGHNNWSEGLTIVERLFPSEEKDGDWWYADVDIPDGALIFDWVVADGPPQRAKVYDNNFSLDFHVTIPMSVPEELFWVEEEHRIYTKLQEERKSKEEAIRRKAEKTALMKAETKERTMNMFLLSQKHTVYTEPLGVRAGGSVTVFYNPSNTVLSGKPDVWFKYSFNRWTHRNGPLPSQKMVRAEDGSHFKLTVKVPLDAYIMDFVFSEKEDGGIYDNKNGMDYHIPVAGGILKEPPMHIVHISVEMAPIAKVGGLGDVVTSLSRAVQDLGHSIDIILPKYDCMNLSNVKDFHYRQSFAWGGTEIKVWFGKVEGISTYFLEPQNGMFSVGCIYGKNDVDRFGFFCHAALEFLLQKGSRPDIIHCHDWSSAPVSWLFKEHYMNYGLSNARVIFTIHNLEFGAHQIGKAMTYTDKATTVSQTYSKEVSGNSLISPHLYKFHGIINGIDKDIWDPYNDNFIPVSYTAENVVEGKKAAKEALQQRLGLKKSDLPLVGIITRLTAQKGIHLIKHAIWRTLDRNGQVVLLGSAPDPRIQNDFVNLANQLHSSHGDRVRLCLTYDEPLSHLIYAGSDFILVPSIFEPCGLTQLIAMRYGSIPVVRKTGGLCDTVFDADNDKDRALAQGLEPNGFSFEGTDSGGVDYALNRALSSWYESREWFNTLCKRAMEQDWSWNRPALDYMELYHAARK